MLIQVKYLIRANNFNATMKKKPNDKLTRTQNLVYCGVKSEGRICKYNIANGNNFQLGIESNQVNFF